MNFGFHLHRERTIVTPRGGLSSNASARRMSTLLRSSRAGTAVALWRNWKVGAAVGVASSASWGIIAGWWTPRGPLTSGEALWSIALSLVVGALSGLVLRSRWAMLVAPVSFAAAFEFIRLDTDGPTVDGIHFSTYGILAFVVGRGFHALLALAPLILGASFGASVAREFDGGAHGLTRGELSVGTFVRRGVAVIASFGLVALAAGLARPASTDAIVGPDGKKLPGSVAELTTVDINDQELTMMIRGHSIKNPVLLFLAGGPGGSELGAMRNHLPTLEKSFTVVTFDQRGTGRSYRALDPTSTLRLENAVDDTIAVTNYLRKRFAQDQIYLAGQSWGSTLGVLALQRNPDAYRAFIGIGQMVSQVETDRIFYSDTLAWAQKNGKERLAKDLIKIGPPPYANMLDYETALSSEHEVYPYDSSKNSEGQGGFSENFIVDEYALIDQVHLLAAFMDTFSVLYPQLQDIDFRTTAAQFSMPMYFVQGAHEAPGRSIPFKEWFAMIDAPVKQTVEFETSGHRPLFEQPDKFVDFMTNTVLVSTSKGGTTDE